MDTSAPATPKGVQWWPCVDEWHTYNDTEKLVRSLSQVTIKAPSGNISEGNTSWQPSELLSDQQAC